MREIDRNLLLSVKTQSNVSALSEGTRVYDYEAENGVQSFGSGVDAAAKQVG
jgi:hypothetical protein